MVLRARAHHQRTTLRSNMNLVKFRVTDFRSVRDSGWIELDDVTALIGVNESGKSNLLLPLWKLNPAREGELHPTSDYPKSLFTAIREAPADFAFVTALFESAEHADVVAAKAGISSEEASCVEVTRYYDKRYTIAFPKYAHVSDIGTSDIHAQLETLLADIRNAKALKSEAGFVDGLKAGVSAAITRLPASQTMTAGEVRSVLEAVSALLPTEPAKTSAIAPLLHQMIEHLTGIVASVSRPDPAASAEVIKLVVELIPKFVYYANYGNLDSEIYLPHVVQNLKRTDLGAKEEAKARTLRVLFSFVRLKPEEILELGRDFKDPQNQNRQPTPDEIAKVTEAKRTRAILLQSASTSLTKEFKAWWKQGDYRFRFDADGDHFRIWVSDDRRPEEIELESRSTGLQWFLSFYLVFLVESEGQHKNAVLLLDEPGMSLHPLAQRDLSAFFESLSAQSNQIVYTSHSPFLVQPDRLDRARKVFVAPDGTTKATPDLRGGPGDPQPGAAYAVYSALNLNIAESLLIGCKPIIVEGPSDQHYLTTIKTLLTAAAAIKPTSELVFPPAGGAKSARITAAILTGRDEQLPAILFDDDVVARSAMKDLRSNLYAAGPDRLLSLKEFVFDDAEVEDLFPASFLAEIMDRIERRPDQQLADVIEPDTPFVPQVEAWAKSNKIALEKHWKIALSLEAKRRALQRGIDAFDKQTLDRWVKLFDAFIRLGQA